VSATLNVAIAVDALHAELAALGTPERAAHERAYLKSDLTFLGVTVGEIRRQAKAFLTDRPRLTRTELLELVGELWGRDVHELKMAAVDCLELRGELLRAEDLVVIERLLRSSHTWAYVDGLAADVAGPLVERFPDLTVTLDGWALDPDFWIRRSGLLSLLRPLRRGAGDLERFLGYADAMLDEKEFFIRKAIGWVLREVAKRRPEPVRDWLAPRIGRVSGVTLREAVRYLPAEDREALMAAYRAR
jgi:3-methyladenine DNA glycosylase AlkD